MGLFMKRGSALRGHGDERGAIMVLAAFGIVVAVIAASLAVDLGQVAQERRRNQKVADLAALDAARDLTNVQALAEESATRNDFPLSATNTVVAVVGSKVSGSCVADAGAGTVCVTVQSNVDYAFRAGDPPVKAVAVAGVVPLGGFMIGSSLATVDTNETIILNNFIGRIIRGSSLSLSAVSYNGLVSGDLTLEALRLQLASAGFSVGTVSQLLDTELTLGQLFLAAANALTAGGETAAANALNLIRASVTTTTKIKLGNFIEVAQGADDMALGSTLNAFGLVTAAAQVANGENLISVPGIGITVPGVLTTDVTLKVIEPPRFYYGPEGKGVSTSQIELSVTTDLNLNLSILGLTGAKATGKLPVRLTGAGATGTLKDVDCDATPGMTITIDPQAVGGTATTDANGIVVSADVLFVNVPLVRVPVTTAATMVDGPAVDRVWSFPTQFPPPDGTTTTQSVGSEPIGLANLTDFSTGTPVVLGALPIPVGNIVSGLLTNLDTLLGTVDTNVVTPLVKALGVAVGAADVTALSMKCGTPGLLG